MTDIHEKKIWKELKPGLYVKQFQANGHHLIKFKLDTIEATVGYGDTTEKGKTTYWATIYGITKAGSDDFDFRDATPLLKMIRDIYKKNHYDFAYSHAENTAQRSVLYKSQIKEREPGELVG